MTNTLFSFIGVHKDINTEADEKFVAIVQQIMTSIEKLTGFELNDYDSLQDLIDDAKVNGGKQRYFWDWLDEKGQGSLKTILRHSLPDNDDVLDLLEYREMLLEIDVQNGILSSYFTSVADTLYAIREVTLAYLEESAASEGKTSSKGYKEPFQPKSKTRNEGKWEIHFEKPAEHQQVFCYY
ncbi:hypothetical protein [Halobacillus halophilus]|uniref:hypothetical protein n=1 Tax=Halobacillus halophilus TaxID=1570 RepID=UPI001CD70897|nr:hypothetical protein [Halobacillus halophilus]MCA1010376.1 hypothetical protein [Halobacillus halophilus]